MLVVVGVAWAGVLLAIAPQRIYLTTDMVSNHVHVWFIANQLWHGHGIPLHMPVLASGDAFTFPYASLPWIVGGLLWPLGGDHVVTVLLVVGDGGRHRRDLLGDPRCAAGLVGGGRPA